MVSNILVVPSDASPKQIDIRINSPKSTPTLPVLMCFHYSGADSTWLNYETWQSDWEIFHAKYSHLGQLHLCLNIPPGGSWMSDEVGSGKGKRVDEGEGRG